jgi:D-amino-acid oxidase
MAQRIAVIGSGVVGLATAVCLGRKGYDVRVVAAEGRFRPTSPVAGALWYPYAVNLSVDAERALAGSTFRFFVDEALKESERSGCRMVAGVEYFDDTLDEASLPEPWWSRELPEADFRTLRGAEIPRDTGPLGRLCRGWHYRLPVVDMARFLPWLRAKAAEAKVEFDDNRTVSRFDDLHSDAQAIVNCAGGWATHLTRDEHLYGLQGVVVLVTGGVAGDRLMFVERGACAGKPVYIIPHSSYAVLGGTAEQVTVDGEPWPTDDRLWSPDVGRVREIVARCAILRPQLAPMVDDFERLWQQGQIRARAGLRPRRRDRAPRIELGASGPLPVVHNYGHGGSGITLCWGSALQVAEMIRGVLS